MRINEILICDLAAGIPEFDHFIRIEMPNARSTQFSIRPWTQNTRLYSLFLPSAGTGNGLCCKLQHRPLDLEGNMISEIKAPLGSG